MGKNKNKKTIRAVDRKTFRKNTQKGKRKRKDDMVVVFLETRQEEQT